MMAVPDMKGHRGWVAKSEPTAEVLASGVVLKPAFVFLCLSHCLTTFQVAVLASFDHRRLRMLNDSQHRDGKQAMRPPYVMVEDVSHRAMDPFSRHLG